MITAIHDAVLQLLPAKRKSSPSGWISFNAPCCVYNGESADKRNRGGVKTNTEGSVSYHCFNCNFKASYVPGRSLSYKFRKLLGWLGASDNEVHKLVIDAVRIKELVNPEDVKPAEPERDIAFKVRPLPEQARTFSEWGTWHTLQAEDPKYVNVPADFGNAVLYASNRKINLDRYELYWTPESEHHYSKRVIIPFYWKGQLIGSTARTFVDGIKPKYYSDYEPNYVFNLDQQHDDNPFVIVVEGPFDAMAIDGVAILSNECSDVQAEIIDNLGKEVIVVADADRAGTKLIDAALKHRWAVSYPIWQETHKDVASAVEEFGRLFVLKSILEAKETSRLKIELKKKKLYN